MLLMKSVGAFFISFLLMMGLAGASETDVVKNQIIFGINKDTFISSLKFIAAICFILGAIFSFASVRTFLYKLFLKFEIQINKIISFLKKILDTKLFQIVALIANKVIGVLRVLRLTDPNVYIGILGVVLSIIVIRPEFLQNISSTYMSAGVIEFITAISFAGTAFICGYLAYEFRKSPSYASAEKDDDFFTSLKKEKIIFSTVLLNLPLLALGLYSLHRELNHDFISIYAISFFAYFCYSFNNVTDINNLKFQKIFLSSYAIFIPIAYVLAQPTGSLLLTANQVATFVACVGAFFIGCTLNGFTYIDDQFDINGENLDKIDKIKAIFLLPFPVFLVGHLFVNDTNHITSYIVAVVWAIFAVTMFINSFPELKNIFSGKYTWILAIIAGVLSFNTAETMALKQSYGINNFYWSLGFFMLFAIYATMSCVRTMETRDPLYKFWKPLVFSAYGLVICVINHQTLDSKTFIIFGILCVLSIIVNMIINFEINLEWLFKNSDYTSMALLWITLIVQMTGHLPNWLYYLPHVSFALFMICNCVTWFKTFIETSKFNVIFLATMFIPAILYAFNIVDETNHIGASGMLTAIISVATVIIVVLTRIYKGLGYFSAGLILYYVATLFEDGTLSNIFNTFKGTF